MYDASHPCWGSVLRDLGKRAFWLERLSADKRVSATASTWRIPRVRLAPTRDLVALTDSVRKADDPTGAHFTRVKLLGVDVDPLTIEDLHSVISRAVLQDDRMIVAHHNLHSVYLWHRDPAMRGFYERAHAVHIDGMALVLLEGFWGCRSAATIASPTWIG